MLSFSFPRARVALSTFAMMISIFDFVHASPTESPGIRRATICNGSPDLCTRSFGNVTFVGAHDSYAVGTNNGELTLVHAQTCSITLLKFSQLRTTTVSVNFFPNPDLLNPCQLHNS
jgi:hypothetical protein